MVGQQLSGSSARAILAKLVDQLPTGHAFLPSEVSALPENTLRACGLSSAKTATVKELAKRAVEGVLPVPSRIQVMPDEKIIEELTTIRGIGRWTVEIFLIFTLGRQDVLPVGDFSVRKGFARTYGRKELPTAKELLSHGEKWRPYRTTAALYLYDAVDVPQPVPDAKMVRKTE